MPKSQKDKPVLVYHLLDSIPKKRVSMYYALLFRKTKDQENSVILHVKEPIQIHRSTI
jgi:hypothetical protein